MGVYRSVMRGDDMLLREGSEIVVCIVVCVRSSPVVFFFFQAEDGIRDVAVTGVQTCALPIYYRNAVCESQGGALALPYRWQWRVERWKNSMRGFFGGEQQPRPKICPACGGIGRAAGRGRVEISVGAGSFKKKKKNISEQQKHK